MLKVRAMKDDLIKRSDAIKALHKHFSSGFDCDRWWNSTTVLFALNSVPSADRPQGWTLCSERLPDACKEVLLTCEVRPINHKPFRYVCTAQWIPKFCKEALSIDWDEEATEYCEEDDEFYPHEGWYESISNWDDYSLVGISDFAIAWKPLPEPMKGADDE